MNSMNRSVFVSALLVLLPGIALAQSMNTPGTIVQERVNVRSGPGSNFERFTLVDRETRVTAIARQGDWVKIELPSGETGWIIQQFVQLDGQPAPSAPSTKSNPPAKNAALSSAATSGAAKSVLPPPAIKPAPVKIFPGLAPANPKTDKSSNALAGTKPDPLDRTQDNPAASVGDAWKLLVYLVPILGLTLLAIRGLKMFQERAGSLPSLRNGILGGFNLVNARKVGGSSVRVVESVPVGSIGLHLVEVRGRLLLLGTSGSSVSLLTELKEPADAENTDFQMLLNSAALEMDDGLVGEDGHLSAVVGTMDDSVREAREIIARSAARVRQWNVDEEEDDSSPRAKRA